MNTPNNSGKLSALDKIRSQYKSNSQPITPRYSEAEVQASVIKKYKKEGWLVNKIIQCTNNGWPDLELYKNKVVFFVECKATGETPNKLQEYRHQLLRDQGFAVLIIDTVIK